jgi:hypothetical protein
VEEHAGGAHTIIRCEAGEIYTVPADLDEPNGKQRIYVHRPNGSERELKWVVVDQTGVTYKLAVSERFPQDSRRFA